MNKYSVWYMPYNKRYLITHPWKWFKCAWRNIRDAWRRSVYGWTYGDVWDWYSWFLHTVPDMFRYMADNGCAYPGCEPFTTPEKWHDWLHEMADLLETGREDWQDKHNEYYEEHMNEWKPWKPDENGVYHTPAQELDNKYFARMKELEEQGEANVRNALYCIADKFFCLWD